MGVFGEFPKMEFPKVRAPVQSEALRNSTREAQQYNIGNSDDRNNMSKHLKIESKALFT